MKIYDISLTISDQLPIWPGDDPVRIERVELIEEGSSVNVTRFEMSAHAGTHIDAPYHFLGGESPTVEQLDLDVLNGPAMVLQIPNDIHVVTASTLQRTSIPSDTKRLLIRTKNSDWWREKVTVFQKNFVAISADGAQFLVDRGIQLIGVDYLSVAPYEENVSTHKIFLAAGVIIVEGLNLSEISQGDYSLNCLPLKLAGADGAPARAILSL